MIKTIRGKKKRVRVCRNVPTPTKPKPPPPAPPPAPLVAGTIQIRVAPELNGVVAAAGSIWVSTRPGELFRIDPGTNAIEARVALLAPLRWAQRRLRIGVGRSLRGPGRDLEDRSGPIPVA